VGGICFSRKNQIISFSTPAMDARRVLILKQQKKKLTYFGCCNTSKSTSDLLKDPSSATREENAP
jgi:hypothetical protein